MNATKKHPGLWLSGIVLAAMLAMLAMPVYYQLKLREWPHKQMLKCHAMSGAIRHYKEKHGGYPSSLEELVSSGDLEEEQYREWMFTDVPGGIRLHWLYEQPATDTSWALLSPEKVTPHGGSEGVYLLGAIDGSVQMLPLAKLKIIPLPEGLRMLVKALEVPMSAW